MVTPRAAGPTDTTKERAALNRLALGAELIAFGRGFLTNPDFVERPRTDVRLNPPRYLFRGPAMGRLAPGSGMAVCPLSKG
ncbi:hypothetical protein SHIRM173S_02204 [Streptomyces hirsutus]